LIQQIKKDVENSSASNEGEMKIITEKLNSIHINLTSKDINSDEPIKLEV